MNHRTPKKPAGRTTSRRSGGEKDSRYGHKKTAGRPFARQPRRDDDDEQPRRTRRADDKPRVSRSKDDKPRFARSGEDKPRFSRTGGSKPYTRRADDDRPRFSRSKDDKPRFSRTGGSKPYTRRTDDDKPRFSRSKDEKPRFSRGGEDKPRFRRDKPEGGKSPYRPERKYGNRRSEQRDDERPVSTAAKKSAAKKPAAKDTGEVRLNKFIANSGICSRREADEYIAAGVVSVNGKVVTEMGYKVQPGDDVRFNGERMKGETKVYVLLNKPKDFVTTTGDRHADRTVMDLIGDKCQQRIFPVGRLDKATTGVLLLTNDGELADRLTHPSYNKKKIYHVALSRKAKVTDLRRLIEGVELEDGTAQADHIEFVGDDKKEVGLEIHSGRNRVVRRMFEALGYRVEKLDRVYFAGLTKKNLRRGQWRFLTEQEIAALKMGAYE